MIVTSSSAHRVGRSFSAKPRKASSSCRSNQAKEFCGNLPINVAFRDYLLPLKEQEEDQSLFAKVGQG
jgi:hypothetical protein